MHTSRLVRLAAVVGVSALVIAACGSKKEDAAPATTAKAAVTTAAAAPTTVAAAPTTKAATATTAAPPAGGQKNADFVKKAEDAAKAKPLKATGADVVIGFQNPEGDPNGSFPEYSKAAEAAVKYINEELGGVGADYAKGTPGRPIKLEVCKMAITPADSQKCANELAAKKPLAVISSLNFFGNHFAIFNAAKIPVVVGTPITALDFTSPGVYAVGGGGGCLGVHTGLMEFVTNDLKATNVAVPWADTPPGVFCYHDLEKKPLNVLNGSIAKAEGNDNKGKIAALKHIGVAVKPGQADVTAQATQVLDFKPNGIVFSAQGADCWTLVNSMAKLGWTAAKIPLVLSGACLDLAKMKEIGPEITKGIYFVGGASILNPESLEGQLKDEAITYAAKMAKYADGGAETAGKGFATAGFAVMMQVWEYTTIAANGDPSKVDGTAMTTLLGATSNAHSWGSTGMSCADGVKNAPYIAVCNSTVTATQWDGAALKTVRKNYTGLPLIKGTDLDFGK